MREQNMNDIMFEVLPPARAVSESYGRRLISRLVSSINRLPGVSTLNIPEIVEENHHGRPYFRNVDPRRLALYLKTECKKDVAINTVVVHHESEKAYNGWLDETVTTYGIKKFVFVGGKIGALTYPGPTVQEANKAAQQRNLHVGNICIPHRSNEVDRLIQKTRAGCSFFTTQVLFDSKPAANIINEYTDRCKDRGIRPAKFYLSLAPVSNGEDISFLRWLGTTIPNSTERRILHAEDVGKETVTVSIEVLQNIVDKIPGSASVNIGYILLHNMEHAINLVQSVTDLRLPLARIGY